MYLLTINSFNSNKKIDIDETRDQTINSYLGDDGDSNFQNIDNHSNQNINLNNNAPADDYL